MKFTKFGVWGVVETLVGGECDDGLFAACVCNKSNQSFRQGRNSTSPFHICHPVGNVVSWLVSFYDDDSSSSFCNKLRNDVQWFFFQLLKTLYNNFFFICPFVNLSICSSQLSLTEIWQVNLVLMALWKFSTKRFSHIPVACWPNLTTWQLSTKFELILILPKGKKLFPIRCFLRSAISPEDNRFFNYR